jgi:hypothetical protein
VRLVPGELTCDDPLWQRIIAAGLTAAGAKGEVELLPLHRALHGDAEYDAACETPADLWTGLAAAHDWGWLDVSQQVTRSRLSVVQVLRADRPAGLDRELTARSHRVRRELDRLRDWFDDSRCAHVGFAEAFGAEVLPEGTCVSPEVRCSTHWGDAEAAAESSEPALFKAFFTPRPVASATTAEGRANFERRLRRHILELLWLQIRGLRSSMLRRVLHGEDAWFDPTVGRWRRLWPSLLYHRSRGAMRGVRLRAVETALAQLEQAGQVMHTDDDRWRLAAHVHAEEKRAARLARQAAAAQPVPGTRVAGEEAT